MSNNTPNDGSLQSTKQMLDELDALMDRMLSLPVNELEDTPTVGEKPSVLAAKLTILEPPVEKAQKLKPTMEPTPAKPTFNPPHFTLPPSPPAEPLTPYVAPPLPEPEPLTNEIEPPRLLPTLDPLLADIPGPAKSLSLSWWYESLVWINRAFDRVAMLLPGAGSWLRTQSGRMFLGASGFVLTAAAIGWLLKDWLGWNR
jgi:hypothetical protein